MLRAKYTRKYGSAHLYTIGGVALCMAGRAVLTVFQTDKMAINDRILEIVSIPGGERPAGIIKAMQADGYFLEDIKQAIEELRTMGLIESENGFLRSVSTNEHETPDKK